MKILFIGCGLIGGSLAKVLIGKAQIYALTTTKITHNAIEFYTSVNSVPNLEYDIICIATPRGQFFEIYHESFKIAGKFCTKNTLFVDISSVQNHSKYFQILYSNFTPCHPIAGTEKTGFHNSDPSIIAGKKCITIGTQIPEKITDFWRLCNMIPIQISSAEKHDEIFAKISHLPQLLSFNMVPQGGYPNFYRLCFSPKEIWHETFLHNKLYIKSALSVFAESAKKFEQANYAFEQIIGIILTQMCNEEEVSIAGTGFKSVISCANLPNSIVHSIASEYTNEYEKVINLIEKAQNFINQY